MKSKYKKQKKLHLYVLLINTLKKYVELDLNKDQDAPAIFGFKVFSS